MTHNLTLSLFSLTLLTLFRLSHELTFNGNKIQDLEANNPSFANESIYWTGNAYPTMDTVVTLQPPMYSKCGSNYILGGSPIFTTDASLTRIYDTLPPHQIIYYSMELTLINKWNPQANIIIFFDKAYATGVFLMEYDTDFPAIDACGDGDNDLPGLVVYGKAVHKASTLTLRVMSSSFDTDDRSFGIRRINLVFRNKTDSQETNQMCGIASVHLNMDGCNCPAGQFESPSGSLNCVSCDPTCKTCLGSLPSQCLTCVDNAFYDGTQCVQCHPACSTCDGPLDTDCISCKDPFCEVCPINGSTICQRCKDGSILDANGLCRECSTMELVYAKGTDYGHQYNMLLGPNGCTLSQATISQNLAWLIQPNSDLPQFSFQTLEMSSNSYAVRLNFKKSVLEASQLGVSLEYLSGGVEVPKKLIPTPTLETISAYVPGVEALLASLVGVSFPGSSALGVTANIWSIITFQQFVNYLKYVNVEYPYQMKLFFSLVEWTTWDFLPNPLDSLTKSTRENIQEENRFSGKYKPPTKFADDDMTLFFIDNAGGIFLFNICLFLVFALTVILSKLKSFSKNKLLSNLKGYLKWNIVIRVFLLNSLPLLLGVFLQFRILHFSNAYLVFCSLFALLSICYFIVFSSFFAKALYNRNKERLEDEFVQKEIGSLYEGVSLKNKGNKYYNLLILFRGTLLILLVSFCEDIPILQVALLIPFNLGLIICLFKFFIFKDRYLNIINQIKEILVLVGEIGILCLNIKSHSENYYNAIGWIIFTCFAIVLIGELVHILAIQIYNFRQIKKKVVTLWASLAKEMNVWTTPKNKYLEQKTSQTITTQKMVMEFNPMKTVTVTAEVTYKIKYDDDMSGFTPMALSDIPGFRDFPFIQQDADS